MLQGGQAGAVADLDGAADAGHRTAVAQSVSGRRWHRPPQSADRCCTGSTTRTKAKMQGYEGDAMRRVRQLHAGPQRDLYEVQHLWRDERV